MNKHIPIFLCSNNKFAPCIAVVIASICKNSKHFFNFYIIESGISYYNKFKIKKLSDRFSNFSIEFININLDDEFDGFAETSRITKDAFSRFLIPELKPEINKAIYIDVDIIVTDDIAELYYEDLEEYSIGAVWEIHAEKDVNIERKKRLNLPEQHNYFSSGTLLIDCEKWRRDNIKEKLFGIEKDLHTVLECPDMDILNKYFLNNYKPLPVKYSWINQNFEYFGFSDKYTIRHFNGPVKPWMIKFENKSALYSINCKDFWKYAKLTPFYYDFQILYAKQLLKNFVLVFRRKVFNRLKKLL